MKKIISLGISILILNNLIFGQILRKHFPDVLEKEAYDKSPFSRDSCTLEFVCTWPNEMSDIKDHRLLLYSNTAVFIRDSITLEIPYTRFVKEQGDIIVLMYTFAPDSPERFRYVIEAVNDDFVYVSVCSLNRRNKYKKGKRLVFKII